MSANEGYNSDKEDYDKPKDEFLFYSSVFKVEEKKIVGHLKFEQITAQYWQLLRSMQLQDTNKTTISQAQYIELMKRMYKVLLPLYREAEISSEVAQEWIQDSRGQAEITQTILGKILFRVAHWWCTNIDMDEYVDLLQRVYSRITYKKVMNCSNEQLNDYFPRIQVTFPAEEKKISETVVRGGAHGHADPTEWMECASNESGRSTFDYKYEEDPELMVVKKYKKRKNGEIDYGMASGVNLVIKDPFIYQEETVYPELQDPRHAELNDKAIYDALLDLTQVKPFGYPTEQFLRQVKQDIHDRLEHARLTKPASLVHDDEDEYDRDPGLIASDSGMFLDISVAAWGLSGGVTISARVTDTLFNNYRKLLREGLSMTLRLYSAFPKSGGRSRSRSTNAKDEPSLELNRFGYNPSLERRVIYKSLPVASKGGELQFLNVQYMITDPDFETAYRCDVSRIETKGKMAVKDIDDVRREEEFSHVETSYRKLRLIMLQKKYESLYRDRAGADNTEQRRWQGILEGVEKDKRLALKVNTIIQKGLKETWEDSKAFVKMMRGPFCILDSKEGLRDDDFYTCAEQDLITAAKSEAMRILVVGKPRSGKTQFSKSIATRLDLVHINVENWLAALLTKIKAYEPPEDLEEGQSPPRFLSDLEESVHKALQSGSGPSDELIIEIIRLQVHSPQSRLKGYVLDLSYYEREGTSDQSWAGIIRHTKLLGESENGKAVEFTHIVELLMEDEDVRLRALNMRVDPTDGNVYSRWEREERKKPKPKKEGEDEANEDDENAVKPLDELALVQRVNDADELIRAELTHYKTVERPAVEELLINFFQDQYIHLEAAGLTPDELADAVQCRLKTDEGLPLRPLALQIEGAGDFKSLLSEGLEEGFLPRKWSLWKQIDPVALFNGKVMQGTPEFACHYNGSVFAFGNEENLKTFLVEPKKFIQERPNMPDIFRILLLGPRGAGKHTQAQLLSDTYGWKIIDFKQLVKSKLDELIKQEVHIPNNPLQGGRIGLSEAELQEIIEGKPFQASKFVPWILNYLGHQLDKKKPPPPEEKPEEPEAVPEELDEETRKKKEAEAKKKAQEEDKKRKEEEEKHHAKEERRLKRQSAKEQGLDPRELGVEDSEEEVVIIEDLSIDQLIIKTDEDTGKVPFVGGFILLGFPETLDHIEKLKAHGIEFDKILYLNDANEEDPGGEIKKRNKEVELYDFDQDNEIAQKVLALAKEHLGEENVKEINCGGAVETVLIRIRNEIDPFYFKIDIPEDVRVSADLGEEDKRLPKGDFGDYCPVTYVNDNWLVRGNPEQEVTIFGKTYWLAGEKEAEKFKFNPKDYLKAQSGEATLPLSPPPPKIMILGHRGAGTSTVIKMLCDKFKLNEFELKKEYLKRLKEEKDKRKRTRLLNRGFRPPAPAEEEGMEPPADPEIEDDPEDFDREGHERQVMKMIFDSSKGYIIDGSWRELPEGAVGQSLQDLLFESRRVPEIVVILKCKEASSFQRLIRSDAIKAEYDRLMEVRASERKRVRDEERLKRQAELKADEEKQPEDVAAEMAKWEDDQDAAEEAAEEGDPEKPDLEAMLEKEREALREARTTDDTFFEEFATVLKDKQVFVVEDIRADTSAEFLLIKLLDRIKDNLQYRKDMLERQLAQPLKPEEVKFYEKSYTYKHSKYGSNSCLSLSQPSKNKRNTVLYRERLYFLSNKEEQQLFLKEPSKYTQNVETIPLDLTIKPKVMVLGLPKSGKSTVCKMLADKIGVVHLKMSKIIQSFMNQDSVQGEQLRKHMKADGRQLEDDQLVNLLIKRVQMKDCQSNGWVIEDFPKTRNQAMFLAKRGVAPTNVIFMKQSIEETFKRTHGKDKFGSIRTILATRIKYFQENMPYIQSFYQRLYNSLIEIDSTKSKWFIEERSLAEIQKNIEARQNFSRDYHLRDTGRSIKMKDLHMDRCLVKQSLSPFLYFCPVTWKNEKTLLKCNENTEDCVLYDNAFYFFRSTKERDMFISNPNRFLAASSFPKGSELPLRAKPHKACEVIVHEKAIHGHCPVSVMDEERVIKGDQALLVVYREDKYIFESEFKLQRFLANPSKYSRASLPVKMPPPDDKISLHNLQKMDDSISYMEQALGQIVTRGLREVSENRLKYPSMSLKETMLKLFALFLKAQNPANTESMNRKYQSKIRQFIMRCELPEELHDLAMDKDAKKPKGHWPEFKENYYNAKGAEYDGILKIVEHEKLDNFQTYIR